MKHPAPYPVKLAVVILLPCVAAGVQGVFWSQVQPHAWYFFLPAVFLSGRLCGRVGAVMATGLSVALMAWFFLDPVQSLRVDDPRQILSMALFASVGLLLATLLPRHRPGAVRVPAPHRRFHPGAATAPGALAKIKAS